MFLQILNYVCVSEKNVFPKFLDCQKLFCSIYCCLSPAEPTDPPNVRLCKLRTTPLLTLDKTQLTLLTFDLVSAEQHQSDGAQSGLEQPPGAGQRGTFF
jgi:hypothetical protein